MTDTTPPVLISSWPADSAIDVPQDAPIVLTFDEPISLGHGSIELDDITHFTIALAGAADQLSDYVVSSGNQVIVHSWLPDLRLGDTYRLSLSPGAIQDLAGNGFAGATVTFTATTIDTLPPGLGSPWLRDTNLAVKIDGTYVFNFDEPIIRSSGDFQIHKNSDGALVSDISINDVTQVTFSGTQVTLDPKVNLDPYTAYYITLSSGAVTDTLGHPYSGFSSPWDFSFITGDLVPPSYGGGVIYGGGGPGGTRLSPFSGPDTTAPSLTAISPIEQCHSGTHRIENCSDVQ